jgi:hypothetical protein
VRMDDSVRGGSRRSVGQRLIPGAAVLALGSLLLVGTTADAADSSAASEGIRLDGERLSLRVDGMPLTRLVASVNRSGHVAVVVRGDAAGMTVSDLFRDTDVGDALRRLLSTRSHVLIDRRSADATRVLEVILLPSPASAGSEPAADALPAVAADGGAALDAASASRVHEAPRDERPTEELVSDAQSSATATGRAAAAEALAYRSQADAATGYAEQVLTQQLSDADEQVRARALETLKDTSDVVPATALAQVARDDVSAERRIQALELLAERTVHEARGPLRLALADPEPAVRKRARELIEDWDRAR